MGPTRRSTGNSGWCGQRCDIFGREQVFRTGVRLLHQQRPFGNAARGLPGAGKGSSASSMWASVSADRSSWIGSGSSLPTPDLSVRRGRRAGHGLPCRRSISHVFAGNMTWRVSDSHSLSCRSRGPDLRDAVGQTFGEFGTPATFLNPDPYLGKATLGGLGVRIKGTHMVSEELLLESSLSWMGRNDRFLPATEVGEPAPLRGRSDRHLVGRVSDAGGQPEHGPRGFAARNHADERARVRREWNTRRTGWRRTSVSR